MPDADWPGSSARTVDPTASSSDCRAGASWLPRRSPRRSARALDVIVVRKLRAPDDPELAIGALVAAAPPDVALDEGAIETLKVSPDYVLTRSRRSSRRHAFARRCSGKAAGR